MNTPTGIQVPATLLPAIDEIINNELVMLYILPGTDLSIVEAHWQQLQEHLGDAVTFTDLRGHAGEVGSLNHMIDSLRHHRAEASKPWFLIYNFAPRFSRLELEADVSFYYCPGAGQVNLQRGKCRRAATPNAPKVLELLPPRTPVGAAARLRSPNRRLQVIVTGDQPGCGKTTLAVELRNFLEARFPTVAVVHYGSDNAEVKREQNTHEHVLSADQIQVIDIDNRPIRPETLQSKPVSGLSISGVRV